MTVPEASSSGPPELPGVQRGVGLQHVGDRVAVRGGDRAVQRGDHARGQRAVEAVGRADGVGRVADLDGVGVAERERRQPLATGADLEQRDIGRGVGADDLRGLPRAAADRDLDRRRAVDDMVVGDDVAVGGDDEAGARRRPVGGLLPAERPRRRPRDRGRDRRDGALALRVHRARAQRGGGVGHRPRRRRVRRGRLRDRRGGPAGLGADRGAAGAPDQRGGGEGGQKGLGSRHGHRVRRAPCPQVCAS